MVLDSISIIGWLTFSCVCFGTVIYDSAIYVALGCDTLTARYYLTCTNGQDKPGPYLLNSVVFLQKTAASRSLTGESFLLLSNLTNFKMTTTTDDGLLKLAHDLQRVAEGPGSLRLTQPVTHRSGKS